MNEIAGPAAPNAAQTPSRYTNRGALSEAWFRSLYATGQQDAPSSPQIATRAAKSAQASPEHAVAAPRKAVPETTFDRAASTGAPRRRPALAGAAVYRIRRDHSGEATPVMRRWRVALARRMVCRFALPGGGSVDLLVQQRGRRLHVVAVANGAPKSAPIIGDALIRAQAALAAHGLRIEIDVREKGSA